MNSFANEALAAGMILSIWYRVTGVRLFGGRESSLDEQNTGSPSGT